jgi:hypothetical protein
MGAKLQLLLMMQALLKQNSANAYDASFLTKTQAYAYDASFANAKL